MSCGTGPHAPQRVNSAYADEEDYKRRDTTTFGCQPNPTKFHQLLVLLLWLRPPSQSARLYIRTPTIPFLEPFALLLHVRARLEAGIALSPLAEGLGNIIHWKGYAGNKNAYLLKEW